MKPTLLLLCAYATFGQELVRPSGNVPGLGIAHTEGKPDSLFWPQMAYAGAGAFDIASSWGAQELNPIAGRGTFGTRQAVMSASITAGVVLASHVIVKKWPSSHRVMRWSLIGGGMVRGYASSRAVQLHGGL